MPPLGALTGGVDFSAKVLTLKEAITEGDKVIPAVTLNYGLFLNNIISFVIIAFALFMVIKGMNALKKKQEAAPAAPAAPPADVILLTEIRDLLKK
ncbi:MAG: Large-conductance mechanosensitive channel [Verrucomicrobia bacterium ADurb.Bin345]|nr:MAG: Large-conductance mechanosensitive channel [Verrucomicrobia bacterium ADurb.Bin345]